MDLSYILLLFFFLIFVEYYFFGMQRALIEAGRVIGVKLDFLLPRWYGIGTVISIAKFAVLVWVCFISVGLAVFLFIFSFLVKVMCPIPRKIYSRIFKNRINELNTPEDVKGEICSALLAVGVCRIDSASNKRYKNKLSDFGKILKVMLLAVFLALGVYFSFYEPYPDSQELAMREVVYICNGPYAEVYHKAKSCDGLSKCSGKKIKTNKEDVKDARRPCRICYDEYDE